jgi:hypothetical protein
MIHMRTLKKVDVEPFAPIAPLPARRDQDLRAVHFYERAYETGPQRQQWTNGQRRSYGRQIMW